MIRGVYRFLPVQLFFLHFRKYQFLLIFWAVLIFTLTGNFASSFGASTLFLVPEYAGTTNFLSMFLLGCAMGVFIMAWHITTFIIHSQRVPFMGATRHAFLKYCINNSLLPGLFLIFYTILSIRFQWRNEQAGIGRIITIQLGFYLGLSIVIFTSFLYFFRVDRDLLKIVLSRITNPAIIREIIPYDSLDYEIDIIRADTYLTGHFKVRKCSELDAYHPRLLRTVLRRHHRNAITAAIFSVLLLIISGWFIEEPLLRLPAGAGFLILFSIIMSITGAVKYLLRSWEVLGWIVIITFISVMVSRQVFDLRSKAYGMNYTEDHQPTYDYEHLKSVFTPARYENDKKLEEQRLDKWKQLQANDTTGKPPVIIISVSGGGSRSAYWTFRCLQYLDSATNGQISKSTVMLTGASGGMIGASYWRELHKQHAEGKLPELYNTHYQENVGKDLLNSIIFSFASVDLVSPFSKVKIDGYSYNKDRGYAMEQELIYNTEGALGKKIRDYHSAEAAATIPAMIVNTTIINDGRKLMIGALPLGYLTQPEYALNDSVHKPAIDAIDFGAFFHSQDPYNLRLATALRMNATFPYILPVVKLPGTPAINVMDAGFRDNFGMEVASRYMFAMRNWLTQNAGKVIYLEIRDTKEHEIFPSSEMKSLGQMLLDPVFVIQQKWEPFQSYYHGYIKDYAPYFLDKKLEVISMQYMPEENEKAAALNFHLTAKEKNGILASIYQSENQYAVKRLVQLLDTLQ
ncbi:MAG: hypothetical protein EOP51_00485 [Sphingobacteriales bacterium]|nr:MAG: hypothetical protein EOP51_00485 [Sphingobacteriales bacterium]